MAQPIAMEPIPIPDESEPFQDKQDDVTNPESLDEVDEEEHKTFLRWQQRRQSRGLASFKAAYSRRSALYRSLIGVVLLSMIMLAILCTLGSSPRMSSFLPKAPGFELVISHFAEDPESMALWINRTREVPIIKSLGSRVTIYTKGPEADTEMLKNTTGADQAFRLPNSGREGGTYLDHILRVHQQPAGLTMFAQADLQYDDFGRIVDRLTRHLRADTGFLTLTSREAGFANCLCDICENNTPYPRLMQIGDRFNRNACGPNRRFWSAKGLFVVSAARIREHPLAAYQWLHGLLTAPMGHTIHSDAIPRLPEEIERIGKSTPDHPLFGYTVERAWHLIFGCQDMSLQATCQDFKDNAVCGCSDKRDEL